MRLANTEQEFLDFSKDEKWKFIGTMKEWEKANNNKEGILSECSQEALLQFSESVTFVNGTLAHAHYAKLEEELGEEKLLAFMALFGIGKKYFLNIRDHECDSPGNCLKQPAYICTVNC